MKKCSNCGTANLDDSRFCENCGSPLPEKSKGAPIAALLVVFAVIVVLVLGAAAYVGYRYLKPKKDVVETAEDGSTENFLAGAKDPEAAADTAEAVPEDMQKDPASADVTVQDYASADINAVDDAYVSVSGKIMKQRADMILILDTPVSVSAYDNNRQIKQIPGVNSFWLEGSRLEEYENVQADVKGKLLVDESGNIRCSVVNVNVTQMPEIAENAEYLNHRYEIIVADVTWLEAAQECRDRGGYLVQINSAEEFQYLTGMIEDSDNQNVHFYLGGCRGRSDTDYYWVDAYGANVGEMLNPVGSSWAADYWMDGEPSYESDDEEELYMNLIYYKENWVLNDVPNDITMYYPGKTGYICEYDQ